MFDQDQGLHLARETVQAAQRLSLGGQPVSLATAESLTGGLLGQLICSIPGASEVYRGGVISYATDLKAQLLGVDAQLLDQRGAVDPDVALAMAAGARRVCSATYALATTGVAGPAPADGKPVGRVYLALVGPGQLAICQEHSFEGDRQQIRLQAALAALSLLKGSLEAALPQ